MAGVVDRIGRLMPRQGVLATEAGRRVALGVAAITGISAALAGVVLIGVVVVSGAAGVLQPTTVRALVFGAIGGLVAVALSFLLLPLVSRLGGVAGDFRLLELSNPGSPLLRDLMRIAPGTYSHSIMTGSLAERAAAEIGANGLLARVGAYYHDIGKSLRPNFFVENQAGYINPHDIASPEQSAFVITAHVREGAELARMSRLPDAVVDIINQHHGTSLVACFWEKARLGVGPVTEADFRYDGERPASREAALVMLADVSEAAARAVVDPSLDNLHSTVARVIEAKMMDGQLADSRMSTGDIETTVKVFSEMLASVYHTRVEYPEDVEAGRAVAR
jgi:putative nucleotidyltransferase with HDIG domain